ncbi:hypothetical protein Tco_0393061 [Tanacetum coccineum]
MTLHRRTCGALGGHRSSLLLSWDIPLLHRLLKTGMKFRDWVRSFGISFASLSFAMTGSLESLKVSLFRKFRLSFSVGLSCYFALAP